MQFEINTKPITETETPIEWAKWYEGDSFEIVVSSITFKDEGQPVFYLIDDELNVGTSVYAAHHPNAKFTDATPHGVRLANAIGRAFSLTGSQDAASLCEAINNAETRPTVRVAKTEKGVLWTVEV
tara:strand:- start:187 stop:564 length:378 start_codon:yes stop_codon:yes gene_type:complete